jgi:hypothetical protein
VRQLHHAACALLAALCVAAAVAQPANAAPTAIAQGTVEWGFKASWRAYIGEAGITPSGGVTRTASGGFAWPVTGGSYDGDGSVLELRLGGTVHFTAHDGMLDTTMSNGRLVISRATAEVRYDVRSKTMEGGQVTFEDEPVALLDASAVTPQVAGGTTTWTAIPTAITEQGAAAFTYAAGTALDPLTISYEGPGGAPDWAETWTAPGTYTFRRTQSRELLPNPTWSPWIREAFVDEAAGVVHAIGYPDPTAAGDHLFAVDLATGSVVADAGAVAEQRYAFDPVTHTVYVGGAGGTTFTAHRYEAGSGYTSQSLATGVGGTVVTWDPATSTAALANSNGYVVLARPVGDGSYTTRTVTVTGLGGISGFALDGQGGAIFTTSSGSDRVKQVDLSGATATAEVVAGPVARVSYALAVARPGEAWISGSFGGGWRAQRLTRAGTGAWQPAGEALALPGYVQAWRPSGDGRRLYGLFAYGNAVHVIEDGRVRGTIATDGPSDNADNALAVTPNADGSVWVVHPHRTLLRGTLTTVPWIADRHELDEVSPAVTAEPQDATVTLAADQESETVELTAAASGTPAPRVRWQSRVGGVGRFRDLAGASATTLAVDVTRDHDGTEYRAVFTNAAGELATQPATVTVRWPPRISQQPRSVAVVEGEDALLKVMPLGNPHPTVTWQARVGGFWRDLDPDDGDVELSGEGGGFLTVKRTTRDQDGTRLRAKVSNAHGTVFSDVVELAVSPAASGVVTFGSGTVDWGFAERWRCYVTGTIARGAIEPGAGVARVPGSAANGATCAAGDARSEALRFPVRGGSWDAASGRLEVRLGGSVRFWGHAHHVPGDTRPQLDTTFSNLRVVVEGGRGALYADTVGATMDNPTPVTRQGVELVSLDLAGLSPSPTADGLAWTAVPTALTSAGAGVFDQYPVGEPFDPVSLSLVYGTPQPDPETPPSSGGEQPAPGTPSDPPVVVPPTVRAPAATVAVVKGRQLVGAKRLARLATVACPARAGRCTVTAPARVRVAIGGRRHVARVVVSKAVRAGRRAAVRLQLTRAAVERLRGRTATVKVKLVVRAGKAVTRKTATVRIGARRVSSGARAAATAAVSAPLALRG